MLTRTLTQMALAWVILCVEHTLALGQSNRPLSAETLLALPNVSPGGIVPQLEISWSSSEPEQFELLACLHTQHSIVMFNPFGLTELGCPYFIVIADPNGVPIGQVSMVLPANASVPSPDIWVRVGRRRVIGRAFLRQRDFTRVDPSKYVPEPVTSIYQLDLKALGDDADPVDDLGTLQEGEYFLYLVTTKRLESERLFDANGRGIPEQQQKWMSDEMDAVVCRSPAKRIRVGSDGKIQRPSALPTASTPPIRLTAEVQDAALKIVAMKVATRKHFSLDPGLAEDNILGIDVIDPLRRDLRGRFGSGRLFADQRRKKFVPNGGIIGYTFNTPPIAGFYDISVRFDKDLWMDQPMEKSESEASIRVEVTEHQLRAAEMPVTD